MFYSTQVKSIVAGGIIDMQGRYLKAVGRIPARVGDRVYTDGNVIFGDVKPKGSSLIVGEASGIPILSGNLRGYVSTRGKYKSYRIAGNEWIVNSDKVFAHDTDASNIIDAEIAADGKDGNIYTVEKVVVESETVELDNVLFYYYYSYEPDFYVLGHQQKYFSMTNFDRATLVDNTRQKIACGWLADFVPEYVKIDSVIKQPVLIIRKGGEVFYTIPMQELVAGAEDFALQCASVSVDLPEQHINTRAQLLNFKILPDGSWVALVIAEVGAERDVSEDDNGKLKMATVAAHLIALDKITSDGNCERIAQYIKYFPFYRVTNLKTKLQGSPSTHINRKGFPYEDMDITSWQYSSAGTTILEYATGTVWDSRKMANAPDYDNPDFTCGEEISFPVQDGYHATLKLPTDDVYLSAEEAIPTMSQWKLDVISNEDKVITFASLSSQDNAHLANMSLIQFKNGDYLFGIREDAEHDIDGALYKIGKDGNIEQVGSGLKNFRLRELKQISKARK